MNTILAFWTPGGGQIILLLVVILLLFGAKRLPELAKGLGGAIKEFKKAGREVTDDIQASINEEPPPPPRRIPPQNDLPPATPPSSVRKV